MLTAVRWAKSILHLPLVGSFVMNHGEVLLLATIGSFGKEPLSPTMTANIHEWENSMALHVTSPRDSSSTMSFSKNPKKIVKEGFHDEHVTVTAESEYQECMLWFRPPVSEEL
jgi:hypothetical protein